MEDMNPLSTTEPHDVDVVIVGAGFAGLGLGIRLSRASTRSFVLLERADDLGGTWRDNTYPGVRCDVPSHLYSYSFRLNPNWSQIVSPGWEIQQYLQDAAREEGVLPHIRLGAEVLESRWDEQAERWVVTTPRGVFRGRFLASATGLLSDVRFPDVPGIESFAGDFFHSARWNHDVSLEGKRVGVVGTGASAIQIVPEVAKVAKEVVVFQRSAAYVAPRMVHTYSEGEKRMFSRSPETLEAHRAEIFWGTEYTFAQRRRIPALVAEMTAIVDRHREQQVPDPDLRRRLTPDYEIGCKRILYSNDYYPTFSLDHVSLETSALARVTPTTAVSAAGNEHELDALVFATGFEATEPPFAERVLGRDGLRLSDRWSEGLEAYATLSVHGFPNMFFLAGPNHATGHTSAIYTMEAQFDHVMAALEYAADNDVDVLEVSPQAEEDYVAEVHRRSQGTVWLEGGCNSWYLDRRTGRLTLIWPDFGFAFRDKNAPFIPEHYGLTDPVAAPAEGALEPVGTQR